jgi:hypothetical protein
VDEEDYKILRQARLYGVTPKRVRELFAQWLPEGATVLEVPHDEFVLAALRTEALQAQIRTGVYTLESVAEELLSPACAWPQLRAVEVDVEQVCRLMEKVPTTFAEEYTAWLAIHEAQHLVREREPGDLAELLAEEADCNAAIMREHPTIAKGARLAERFSPIARSVRERMAGIG